MPPGLPPPSLLGLEPRGAQSIPGPSSWGGWALSSGAPHHFFCSWLALETPLASSCLESSVTAGTGGAGLTCGWGQQAQVVETLVAVELPLLKQEVHHLGSGGLQLGQWRQTVGPPAGGAGRVQERGDGSAHLAGQEQQQEVRAAWQGWEHASGQPPPHIWLGLHS